ncbi:L-dopachrome tautomerase yellow-f2-like [Phlebotomus argentipes]|uniref:L-dopachrome tautomerase yellow-f2-like n=1 Tax=Phlebotomus argentipes TaxID=94469 RepID=UPI00289301F7|nr:L-dopachrome tautomerase yellow-f2-like [Phlebotomus argentipes]
MGFHPLSKLMIVPIMRSRPGIPIILGAFCVTEDNIGTGPKIWGFPNYEMNSLRASDFQSETSDKDKQQSDMKRIISVYEITVDEKCNRAFFMDSGMLQYHENETYFIERPALWVIDLPSNGCESREFSIIRRTELPEDIVAKHSVRANGFLYLSLDYQSENACDDLFLYVANAFHNFLVVYDYRNDEFWSFTHETFLPDVSASNMVYDEHFQYEMVVGINSIALGFPDENRDRIAFYTPLCGYNQYSVSTKVLKDKSKSPNHLSPEDITFVGHRGKNRQSSKIIMNYTYGVMFYSEVQSNQLRCWNIKKPLTSENMGVVFDSDTFVFSGQMFIDSEGFLWFQSTAIPIIFGSDQPLDLSKVNNRFFRIKVSEAIRGTICE